MPKLNQITRDWSTMVASAVRTGRYRSASSYDATTSRFIDRTYPVIQDLTDEEYGILLTPFPAAPDLLINVWLTGTVFYAQFVWIDPDTSEMTMLGTKASCDATLLRLTRVAAIVAVRRLLDVTGYQTKQTRRTKR